MRIKNFIRLCRIQNYVGGVCNPEFPEYCFKLHESAATSVLLSTMPESWTILSASDTSQHKSPL